MDNQSFEIQWVPVDTGSGVNRVVTAEEIITMETQSDDEDDNVHQRYLEIAMPPTNLDQIAAENLIYMAQDGQMSTICAGPDINHHISTICGDNFIGDDQQIEAVVLESQQNQSGEQQCFECQVTEEIITDDWVQQQGDERVEISVHQINSGDNQFVEEFDVPLPTDQDEYTALRPYPCDFCSRRFRKKISLMNHMIAHQNDRPHICNLCGARYIRRADLLNHLKIHANIPEQHMHEYIDEKYDQIDGSKSYRRVNDHYYDQDWEPYESNKPKTSKNNKQHRNGRQKKLKIKEEYHEMDNNHVLDNQYIQYPIIDERKPFVCQQCGMSFAREKALLSHSRTHRTDSPLECINCNEMFWNMTALHDHQRSHHFDASNSEYEPEQDGGEDTESENESKYGEYYCNICGMSFHRQDLLRRHSKSHIKKEVVDINGIENSTHCCNVCGENFAEALDLLAHAEIHARFQPYKCVLCGETFLEEATIKKHLTNVHSNEMTTNSCILCGKECRDRKALIKHAWDHSREKNHSCSKCGKTFHNKARLKRHMVSHRNKSVTCEVCHDEFPDGRSLMNHRHSHSNSSGKLFPCHECGKTFGSRSSQQIHVRIHTGERPYGCRFCWKAFADGGTLRKHERIHTGEKPYGCSVCPRAFNQRVVLREHIRSHHSALDSKRGTYFCTVCSDELPTSIDLIQHLIQHSDNNTAMQRQPVTGPRKYKRRRKLKPHELERLRSEKSDIDYSDIDTSNAEEILGNLTPRCKEKSLSTSNRSTSNNHLNSSSRSRKYSGNSDNLCSSWQTKLMASTVNDDAYNAVFSNLENVLQNIEPLVVSNINSAGYATNSKLSSSPPPSNVNPTMSALKSTLNKTNKTTTANVNKKFTQKTDDKSSRPKMIHTQKTRVPVEDGKRKTKTLITRTDHSKINLPNHPERNNKSRKRKKSDSDYELMHQNDSNVMRIKQETTQRDLYDAQLLLEAAATRNEIEKYNPSVVNDLEEILRSPEKAKSPIPSRQYENYTSSIDDESLPAILVKQPPPPQPPPPAAPPVEEEVRRSSRARRSVPNRKYLEFDTTMYTRVTQKSSTSQRTKPKQPKIPKIFDEIEIKSEPLDRSSSSQEYSPIISHNEINAALIAVNNNNNNDDDDDDGPVTPIKKIKYFECEMCSAEFPDRAQLLDHVPIHI